MTRTTTYYIEKLTLTTNKDHDILHRKTNSHHNPLYTNKDHDVLHRKTNSHHNPLYTNKDQTYYIPRRTT